MSSIKSETHPAPIASYTPPILPENTIATLANICGYAAYENGFHDHFEDIRAELVENEDVARPDFTFDLPMTPEVIDHIGAKLMLITTEISEAMEVVRKGVPLDHIWEGKNGKPEGFVVEMLDAAIRIFDLLHMLGLDTVVDLDTALMKKLAFNSSRGPMHGKKV